MMMMMMMTIRHTLTQLGQFITDITSQMLSAFVSSSLFTC